MHLLVRVVAGGPGSAWIWSDVTGSVHPVPSPFGEHGGTDIALLPADNWPFIRVGVGVAATLPASVGSASAHISCDCARGSCRARVSCHCTSDGDCVAQNVVIPRVIEAGGAATLPQAIGRDRSSRVIQLDLDANSANSFSDGDPCLSPKVIGVCRAAIPRFFFDAASESCDRFLYGGCGGNGNNFVTAAACSSSCSQHISAGRSLLPTMLVRGRSALPPLPPLPDNPICSQPKDIGPCRASQRKFFFDAATAKCQGFFYGGCKGNDNRFDTMLDCISACVANQAGGDLLPIVEPPKCTFGSARFSPGDVLRTTSNACRRCTCSAPPALTCIEIRCPPPPQEPQGSGCSAVLDADGCCQIGWQCDDDDEETRRALRCASVRCPAIFHIPPAGMTCTPKYDDNGCCKIGFDCKSA